MILKSEKRFYDEKEKKYKQPLCEFDTENLIVTDTDSSTGASTQNSFVSVYIRRYIPYMLERNPDKLQELVNQGEIYSYLLKLETRAKDAEFDQIEKWLASDKEYLLAVKNDDFMKRTQLYNAFQEQARELILDSILLLPFKIVFLIIAFILKGILYLLAFILNFISEVLVALQYILGSIFVLIAIGGTVVLVKSIQNGSLTGLQGGVLIGVLWLISMAFSLMFYLSSAAADLFESIGDWLGDTALGFFY